MDEADLIERWRRGDVQAFTELVQHWQGPVTRLLGKLGSGPATADLSQEVFLRVYQGRSAYRNTGRFGGWLYRIALNVLRDAHRRERRWPITTAAPPEKLSPELAPPVAFERAESAQLVQRALDELPGPLREVLVLRHYENITFDEMAELLDTPASTLKSRFTRALGLVRKRLTPLLKIDQELSQ